VTHFCKTSHLVSDNFNILRDSTHTKNVWHSHRIADLFGLLEMYVAIECKMCSQESGNFEEALLAISAEEWHIHLSKMRHGSSFLKRVTKES